METGSPSRSKTAEPAVGSSRRRTVRAAVVFPASAFADQCERFAPFQLERDAVDGAYDRFAPAKRRADIKNAF